MAEKKTTAAEEQARKIIEEAEAEAEAIRAQAKEEASEFLAEAKEAAKAVHAGKEPEADPAPADNAQAMQMVTVELFKDSDKYKDPLAVSVNGKCFLIERGVPVQIPLYVWWVIRNHESQDRSTARLIEQETAAFAKAQRLHNDA